MRAGSSEGETWKIRARIRWCRKGAYRIATFGVFVLESAEALCDRLIVATSKDSGIQLVWANDY